MPVVGEECSIQSLNLEELDVFELMLACVGIMRQGAERISAVAEELSRMERIVPLE